MLRKNSFGFYVEEEPFLLTCLKVAGLVALFTLPGIIALALAIVLN